MKIVLFLLLLFAIFVISLCVGSDGLNFSDLFAFSNDDLNGKIMREICLPHTLAALICGAALALSGAAMQSIFKNALASPYTLGISNAGAFGASFYIIFLQEIPFLSIEISTFISAFSCICVMMFLARFLARGLCFCNFLQTTQISQRRYFGLLGTSARQLLAQI